jgi:hypothetical protein
MPAMDGLNLLEAKGSGRSFWRVVTGPRGILVLGNYGKVVLSLATTTPGWYMGMVGRGKGNWAYFRFMERMARWLTKDPALEPIEIILPERAGVAGQEREIRIKVREVEDSTLREDVPARKGAVSVSVFNPDGARVEARLRRTGPSGDHRVSISFLFFPRGQGIQGEG